MASPEKTLMAIALTGLLHGLRPDLPQEYLYDWMVDLVEELMDGEGMNPEDARQLGAIISNMAAEVTPDDSVH